MNYYIDIRIQPDAEMSENWLMNMVYTKFHKALCDMKSTSIGVSFPETKLMLGRLMRIHGSQSTLTELMDISWLDKLKGGYCTVSEILEVPDNIQYRTVSRWQSNMSEAQLRRLVKRGSISDVELKAYKAKMMHQQMTELPYLELQSGSNGHKHRRYITVGDLLDTPVAGTFDQFGLSKTATIPWF